ncbi:MAG: SPFH domain-containing protein [Phycisphaerales bacterium]
MSRFGNDKSSTGGNGAHRPGAGADGDPLAPIDGMPAGVGVAEMPVEEHRRAASVRLRSEDVRQARAASLEAANKSLSDALDIIYRIIVVVMFGLVAMFLLSGFQQVRESEVGIKVAFGAITNASVQPGFTPSLPRPFGEVIQINTAPVALDLNRQFWPSVRDPTRPLEEQGVRGPLKPGTDGSLLTADGNLVHAQLTVNYRRSDPRAYLSNLFAASGSVSERTTAETFIVTQAVMRGTVKTVASLTIDEVLRRGGGAQTPGAEGGAESEAPSTPSVGFDPIVVSIQREAQNTLDALDSGLTVTSVQIKSVSAPVRVIPDFKAVNNAVAEASQKIEQARTQASQTLNAVAGAAARPAIALIREYERAVDGGDERVAQETLATLGALLRGELAGSEQPLVVGDQTFTNLSVAGRVTDTITTARSESDTRTSRARSAARSFQAKLTAYRANPRVFMASEWTRAMLSFMDGNLVEIFLLPPGADMLRLNVNTDPEIGRRIQREEFERQMRENPRYREAMRAGELIQ